MNYKEEYDRMISFLKWALYIFIFIASVFAACLYFIIGGSVDEMTEKINVLDKYSRDIITLNQQKFQLELDNSKKEITNKISDQSKELVREYFVSNKIDDIIDSEIDKAFGYRIAKAIDDQLQKSLKNYIANIVKFNEVTDAGILTRIGWRDGYERLFNYSKNGDSREIREYATNLLMGIKADYDTLTTLDPNEFRLKHTVKQLIERLRKDVNSKYSQLHDIVYDIHLIEHYANLDFDVFDPDSVFRWCEAHPELCK